MNPRPLTPRAQKGILLGNKFAQECEHQYVGTEHILVGLLRLRDGVACSVLAVAGVTEEMVRDALVKAGQLKTKSDFEKLAERVASLETVVRKIILPIDLSASIAESITEAQPPAPEQEGNAS